MSSSLCPRCDGRQSPGRIPLLSEHLLPVIQLRPLRDALASLAGRHWGDYHRCVAGQNWEVGERELYRAALKRVTIFSIDRHEPLGGAAVCLLSNRRLLVLDYRKRLVQISIDAIRAANVSREYDPLAGSSYNVSIHCVGGTLEDPRGDVCLTCDQASAAYGLVGSIADVERPSPAAAPVMPSMPG